MAILIISYMDTTCFLPMFLLLSRVVLMDAGFLVQV
jgi:hypothetical protein